MDKAQLLDRLAIEVARFREIASRDLTAPVPTCPGWSVDDLVRHVANAYLNVVLPRLREKAVEDLSVEDPFTALDRGYVEMVAEFAEPADDRYFWLRRMAQETAIHRVDAELALGVEVTPIPADFAADAIGEMLTTYLHYATRLWPDMFAADLTEWGDRWLRIDAWRVEVHPAGVDVAPAAGADAAATITGDPAALLLWLNNRGGEALVEGDLTLVTQLQDLLRISMNAKA
jgi:uncharacterized protein (TIGR03083 family)